MALEFTLHTRIPLNVLREAVRSTLPNAREETGSGSAVHKLTSDHLSISLCDSQGEQWTHEGELVFENFVYFRLDKTAIRAATEEVLRCVKAILATSDGDCALVYLLERTILARISGVTYAYKYVDEPGFWDTHDIFAMIGPEVVIKNLSPPIQEDEESEEHDEIASSSEDSADYHTVPFSGIDGPEILFGRCVADAYRFDEALSDGVRAARFRGTALCGSHAGKRVLITTAITPGALADSVMDAIGLANVAKIAPLLTSTLVEELFPPFSALVELEPDGVPLSALAVPIDESIACSIGGQLCDIASQAATQGAVICGIRPELVYHNQDFAVSGIVPRAFVFCDFGSPRSYWVGPPFTDCYEPPELLWNKPDGATDVYMIAATVFYLIHGVPPFRGRSWVVQRDASHEEPPRAFQGDPRIGQTVTAALVPLAKDRPSLQQLAAAFREALIH